ncbi:hypothetical protein LVJ94_07040 [Pendulispora rubella]|uniref:Uncharacterized protein n=1 Tax=Pendulispora rubella TaxID=2741070 RepID=A0ABZ2LCS6_9BACT
MNTPPKRPHFEPLSPSVNEARLARQWSAISARLRQPSPRSRRWVFAAAFAAMFVAVAMAATLRSRPREERVAETAPVHADEAREEITLPDGSRVTLDPRAGWRSRASRPNGFTWSSSPAGSPWTFRASKRAPSW